MDLALVNNIFLQLNSTTYMLHYQNCNSQQIDKAGKIGNWMY